MDLLLTFRFEQSKRRITIKHSFMGYLTVTECASNSSYLGFAAKAYIRH